MKTALRRSLLPLFLLTILIVCGCAAASSEGTADPKDGGGALSDALVTARIKTALLLNPHLNSFRINVDTAGGDVTLEGTVPTDIQRDLAGEIARNAGGVKKVANRLQVSNGKIDEPDEVERTFSQAVLDATTTASVKLALAVAKGVKASGIDVSTRWGTVTLTGAVESKAERELATKVAEDVTGVREVVNDITVRG